LLDRMVMIYVETDYACWSRYAKARQFDRGVQQFLAGNPNLLARQGSSLDMQMEPTERAWEMVSVLRKNCRFPADLEMEVYAGIVGKEAAILFLRWCADQRQRPVSAREVLDHWETVAERVRAQRDDLQAVTMNDVITTLEVEPGLSAGQEENLIHYIAALPRDMRFALVKSLVKNPPVAAVLVQDKYDAVVLDAIGEISREAS